MCRVLRVSDNPLSVSGSTGVFLDVVISAGLLRRPNAFVNNRRESVIRLLPTYELRSREHLVVEDGSNRSEEEGKSNNNWRKKKLEIRKSFARIEEKYILPAPGKRNGPSDYGEWVEWKGEREREKSKRIEIGTKWLCYWRVQRDEKKGARRNVEIEREGQEYSTGLPIRVIRSMQLFDSSLLLSPVRSIELSRATGDFFPPCFSLSRSSCSHSGASFHPTDDVWSVPVHTQVSKTQLILSFFSNLLISRFRQCTNRPNRRNLAYSFLDGQDKYKISESSYGSRRVI